MGVDFGVALVLETGVPGVSIEVAPGVRRRLEKFCRAEGVSVRDGATLILDAYLKERKFSAAELQAAGQRFRPVELGGEAPPPPADNVSTFSAGELEGGIHHRGTESTEG